MSSISESFEADSIDDIIKNTKREVLEELTGNTRELVDEYTSDSEVASIAMTIGVRAFIAGAQWAGENTAEMRVADVEDDSIRISPRAAQALLNQLLEGE